MNMYEYMKKLIERKTFKDAEDARIKNDVFYANGRYGAEPEASEKYFELCALIISIYEPVEEVPEEDQEVEAV